MEKLKAARGRKAIVWIVVCAALAVWALFAARFAAGTDFHHLYRSGGASRVGYERAVVLDVVKQDLERDGEHGGLLTGTQDVRIRIMSGVRSGVELGIRNVLNYTTNFLLRKGDAIVVHVDQADAQNYTVSVYSVDRLPAMCLLAALFAAALCGIGGRRGLRALLGMVFTFVTIVLVFIPLLYRGISPSAAASVMAVATVAISLLLLDGPSVKSFSAIVGSFAGIAISAGIAIVYARAVQVSGYTTAEADSLLAIAGQSGMRVGELLFAAFMIATLGAEMDISISVASAVAELHVGNPGLGPTALFRAGMNVGRDMMGMMANTLILAFVGTSLNAFILMFSLERSSLQILNSNAISMEIGESLSGGLAIVLTVPAVAFFSSILPHARLRRRYAGR